MEQNKATNMLLAVLLIAFTIAFGTFGEAGAKYKPLKHVIPCPNAEVNSSGVIQEALETAEQWETVSLKPVLTTWRKQSWSTQPSMGCCEAPARTARY